MCFKKVFLCFYKISLGHKSFLYTFLEEYSHGKYNALYTKQKLKKLFSKKR